MGKDTVCGTTTPILLEAKEWEWEHVSGPHAVDIKSFIYSGKERVDSVNFDVSEDISVHLDFGSVLKILFKSKMYPDLSDGQVFAISDILIDSDNKDLTIVGNVLKRVS